MTTPNNNPSPSRVDRMPGPFPSKTTFGLLVVLLCAGTTMLMSACKTKPKRPTPEPSAQQQDLRKFPPAVQTATLELLQNPSPSGNALLEVKFDPKDARVSKGVRIFPDDQPVELRDDGERGDRTRGDGVFSAIVREDLQSIVRDQEQRLKDVTNRPPRAVFRGREAIALEDPKVLPERFRRLPLDRGVLRPGVAINILDLFSSIDPLSISPEKSLMIIHPDVVQDTNRTVSPCINDPNGPGRGNPNGVWTFKHLVTEMANQPATGIDPRDFVEQWLLLWNGPQIVSSGFTATPRPAILSVILNNWPRVGGKLNLDRSPFRLAAIVNRIDLAENLVYGGGSAGEGRFVFGVMNLSTPDPCDMLPFAIIFEYGVTVRGCEGLRGWARQWIDLNMHSLGSTNYNAALEAITQQFARANADPGKPNGSALNQLRSNENGLNVQWELREFKIAAGSHHLFEDTTKQTPDQTLNGSTRVRDFVNANEPAILNDAHVVPDQFPTGSPFMAATSRAVGIARATQLTTHFAATGIANNDARHHFSLNTCTACHIRETGTVGPIAGVPVNTEFLHIDPRAMPALLSRFLTGRTPSIADSPDLFEVRDPRSSSTIRRFNDLDRRRQKLANIAGKTCLSRFIIPDLVRTRFELPPFGPLPLIEDPRLDGIQDTLRMVH
jgi:hypothetical protein